MTQHIIDTNYHTQAKARGLRKLLSLVFTGAIALLASSLVLMGLVVSPLSAQDSTTFSPVISISVPNIDANADGNNDFMGIGFSVNFTRSWDSDTGCTELVNAVYTVDREGNVGGTPPSLVDSPAGLETICSYDVQFPATMGGRLNLRSGSSTLANSVFTSVSAAYEVPTTFIPNVSIKVPAGDLDNDGAQDYFGTNFQVKFFRSPSADQRCTGFATATYSVNDRSQVSLSGSAAVLINQYAGADTSCSYILQFPQGEGELVLHPDKTTSVNGPGDLIQAKYSTIFSPRTTITVPQKTSSAGGNYLSGSIFNVLYKPKTSITYSCAYNNSVNETYVVLNNGNVSLQSTSAVLVDRPSGVDGRCGYDVTIVVPESHLVLQTDPEPDTEVSGSDLVASVTYESTEISFVPNVNIAVPLVDEDDNSENDFAGTSIAVSFAPVGDDTTVCTPSIRVTYTVGNDGNVSGATPTLVAYPLDAVSECTYTAELPSKSGDLVLQSTSLLPVSYASNAVSFSLASVFKPIVNIGVPRIDDNEDGLNDFAGTTLTASFSPEDGSNTGCTQDTSSTYTVGSDMDDAGIHGDIQGEAPTLIEYPPGASQSCAYIVDFQRSGGNLVLETKYVIRYITIRGQPYVSTTIAGPDYVAYVQYAPDYVRGAYGTNFATYFTPDINISVPQVDEDTDGINDFAGTSFIISFSKIPEKNASCTSSATVTYTVERSGEVAGSPPSLVNRPSGVTTYWDDFRCSYSVTWPSSVESLTLQPSAASSVRASSAQISASYVTD